MKLDAPLQPAGVNAPPVAGDETEIDLFRIFVRALHGYKTVLASAFAGAVISVLIGLSLAKTYTAQAVFLPPGNLDAAQTSSFVLRDDPSDLYMGMLGSRSVADSVIDEVHLMDIFHTKSRMQARAALAGQSKFSVSKNSLISIMITTGDPVLSTDIANAYLDALYKLNGEMSTSASTHRRQFFESQLEIEKNTLNDAEISLKQMQEKTGMVLPEGEAQAGLSATVRLQESIEDAEARLASIKTGSTDQNPQVIMLQAQIDALKSQLHQQQVSSHATPGTGIPSTANMPAIMLDYVRKSRDLKESEALYESLNQQYERSRLAALDPGPQLEIVDRAILPEHKSGPPRTLIVLEGTGLGALLGLLQVLLIAPYRRLVRRYFEVSSQIHAR